MSNDYQLFVGRLPHGTRSSDIEDVFYKYGKMSRCDVKQGGIKMAYGFIEYEDKKDAEDALRGEHGRDFNGAKIVVEWARGPKEGLGPGGRGGGEGGRGGGRYDNRRDRYREDYDDRRDNRRVFPPEDRYSRSDERYSRYERERRYSPSPPPREKEYHYAHTHSGHAHSSRDGDHRRRSFSRSPSRERRSRSRS